MAVHFLPIRSYKCTDLVFFILPVSNGESGREIEDWIASIGEAIVRVSDT